LHDDYNYQDINRYLNKFNKAFVKKLVWYVCATYSLLSIVLIFVVFSYSCVFSQTPPALLLSYPECIAPNDFLQLGYDMAPHEKLHVALLSVESRKQAELLYCLHALMRYLA